MGRRSAFKLDVVSVRLVRDIPLYSEVEFTDPDEETNQL